MAAPQSKKALIGIDFGSFSSCVAIFQNGRSEIAPNEDGNRTTPSFVSYVEEEAIIGESARAHATRFPDKVVSSVKKILGLNPNDPNATVELQKFKCKTAFKDDHLYLQPKEAEYSTEEVSSLILKKLKEIAENFGHKSESDVVVAIPPYFTEKQIHAIRSACKKANLNVRRLIHEPVAAVLSYNLTDKYKDTIEEKNVLVFDMGYDKLDVSVVAIHDGLYQLKKTITNKNVGGLSFDAQLVKTMISDFQRIHKKDPSNNARAMSRLYASAENAKKICSTSAQALVDIDSLFEERDFSTSITRSKFESLCGDLFKACFVTIEQCLKELNLTKKDICDVVLAGGGSRINRIQDLIQEYFAPVEVHKSVMPEEVIAYGAAMESAFMENAPNEEGAIEVATLTKSIGIEHGNGKAFKIFPAGSAIPSKRAFSCAFFEQSQTSLYLKIVEGESENVSECTTMGTIGMASVEPGSDVEVTFQLDPEQLKVSLKNKKTQQTESIQIPISITK